jgi:hypothetical protein
MARGASNRKYASDPLLNAFVKRIIASFSFLEKEYRFQLASVEVSALEFVVEYRGETVAIKICYELGVLPWIVLESLKREDRKNPAAYNLDEIIMAICPERIPKKPPNGSRISVNKLYVLIDRYAKLLKELAPKILRGDLRKVLGGAKKTRANVRTEGTKRRRGASKITSRPQG